MRNLMTGVAMLLTSSLTSAIAQAPAPVGGLDGPRYVPNSFLAIKTHWNTDLAVEAVQDLGITAVHVDFNHNELEPQRGEYDFSDDNRIIRSADLGAQHGLDQCAIVTHPAEWLRVPGDAAMFPNDESIEAFEEFMYQVASKYRGRIKYWQAGGEPHMPTWQGRYVTMLRAFWLGVKRADPENQVVLAGFSGGSYKHRSMEPEFLDIIYRHGGKEYFDIVASHPYCWPLMPEEGRMLETVRNMREVMERNGDEKPLWITEVGWAGVEPSMLGHLQQDFWHRHRSVSEEDQARALARVYLVAATVPWIERVYTFHLSGIPDAGYTEILANPDFYMSLYGPWLGGRVRPKEAYFSVKTVVGMVGESTYTERLDLGPDLWALVFERDEEAVIALWTVGEDRALTFGDTSMVAGVTSMVGTPILISGTDIPPAELKGAGGQVLVREDWPIDWDGPNTLRVSGRPVYVTVALADLPQLRDELQRADARK